jgi:hypothetical protein
MRYKAANVAQWTCAAQRVVSQHRGAVVCESALQGEQNADAHNEGPRKH